MTALVANLLFGSALVGLLAGGSLLAGCASSGIGGGGSTAAPANYKQAVAARMREMIDVSVVKSATITRPHERFMGVYGGTRPVVCVSAVHPGIFGNDVPQPYIFYFNNSKADGFKQGSTGPGTEFMIGCKPEPYLPFPELRSR